MTFLSPRLRPQPRGEAPPALHRFAPHDVNPKGILAAKPRVARNELPWERMRSTNRNPERVVAQASRTRSSATLRCSLSPRTNTQSSISGGSLTAENAENAENSRYPRPLRSPRLNLGRGIRDRSLMHSPD